MRLLIVTDVLLLGLSLKQFFTNKDYEVDIYDTGNILLLNDYPVPNIFILDHYTSGISIQDMCTYLKQQTGTSHIPIIVMSASPASSRIFEKADGFIEKPFGHTDLLRLVEGQKGDRVKAS